jgi:TatD DNase family protein
LIDSHAHLDSGVFDGDRAAVISRAQECGVDIIVNIGIDLESSKVSLWLVEKYPQFFTAIGFHPHNAAKIREGDFAELERLCQQEKVVAIGEIGLDFYRNLSPREMQIEAFKRQLHIAQEHSLPVVIHSRQAEAETLEILTEWAQRQKRERPLGVMHCFSGDATLAQQYLELGFFISIAGPITYPKSRAADVVLSVPLEGLMVETDCPYLAPQPHRGKRNEPAFLPLIVNKITEIRKELPEVIAQATSQNAIRLFNLRKESIADYL